MRLRTLTGLIAVNLVWSAHPVMGKLVLESYSPAHGALLRYAGALGAYLLALPLIRRLGKPFFRPKTRSHWALVIAMGFLTFCFSPLLQMTGLSTSRATDNSLIIAIEPLMTVLLARLVLGERLRPLHLACFGLALSGFALLTDLGPGRLAAGLDAHLLGNVIMLVSLIGEAAYSSLGRKLILHHSAGAVFGSSLMAGLACLLIASLWIAGPPSFEAASWRSTLGLLWLGPLGTGVCYLFWMLVLHEAPVASLAITLFVQPLFGALWGIVLLGDRLTLTQSAGGVLILIGVFAQFRVERGSGSRSAAPLHPPAP